MKFYPACLVQKASSRAARQSLQMFTLTLGSEALTLCSKGMHFIKEPPMLLSSAALFIPGLLLASEISQDKFWEISRFWLLKDIHHRLPDCIHKSSKTNLGMHKLDNTVLLHSSLTQVKIIWDISSPFGFRYKLKRAFAASKIPSKAYFFLCLDFSFYSSSPALQSLTTANSFSLSLLFGFLLN